MYILWTKTTTQRREKKMSRLKAIMNLNGTTVRNYGNFVKVGRQIMSNVEFSEFLKHNFSDETAV